MPKDKLSNSSSSHNTLIGFAVTVILISSFLLWSYLREEWQASRVELIPSSHIAYETNSIFSLTPTQLIEEIDKNQGNPILLYLYTTWCSSCKKQLPIINRIADKFQNSDLKIIALAVDKDISPQKLTDHLSTYSNIYFEPSYLLYSNNLINLLKTKGIHYKKRLPFIALISRQGQIITSGIGNKSEGFLNRKITLSLAPDIN